MVAAAEGTTASSAPAASNGHLPVEASSPTRPVASPVQIPPKGSLFNLVQRPLPNPDGKPRLERVEFLITRTPVEGCELMPYVVIRTASGEAKSAEAIEAKTRGALSVQYRWNRVAATYCCARQQCLKAATMQFVPLLKIAASRVLTEEEAENVIKESFFCCSSCMLESWPVLRDLQDEMSKKPKRNPEAEAAESIDATVTRIRSECVPKRSDGVFQNPLLNPVVKKEVAWIRNYAPTAEDVGSHLELVCRYVYRNGKDSKVDVGPPMSVRSHCVMRWPAPAEERKLLNLMAREYMPISTRRPGTFRVLTYNVLAEIYTTSQTYPNCPNWALAWTYRKRNLIREITKYEADVLCLQEVQADHYEDHFCPYFARLGYEGRFKVKTRESMGRRGKIDGCATFWRKEKYSLKYEHCTEFNTVAQQRTKNSRALNRCLKGNVALTLVLDANDGSGPVVVANTHLFWDPDLTDVKLFQVDVFLTELEMLLSKNRMGSDVPVIIGGDFNSEPVSSVYEYLSTGLCTMTRNDVPADSYGVLGTCSLRHGIPLRSAYASLGQEPQFTNYTTGFVGVLDYLWYNPETVAPVAVLEIPDESELLGSPEEAAAQATAAVRNGIPNRHWSSDHIALMTEFQLLKPPRHGAHGRI